MQHAPCSKTHSFSIACTAQQEFPVALRKACQPGHTRTWISTGRPKRLVDLNPKPFLLFLKHCTTVPSLQSNLIYAGLPKKKDTQTIINIKNYNIPRGR